MRWLGFLMLLATSCGVGACQAPDDFTDVPPQVQPVLTWMQAVQAGDQELFKTVFTLPMQAFYESKGWDAVVQGYQESFTEAFGDYKIEDFSFEFDGGADAGTVSVQHPKMAAPAVRVVRRGPNWKIDEL
jgi:hypothetical protein